MIWGSLFPFTYSMITKELVAKGTAALGSAGAGGTGIYYGSQYASGLSKNGATLKAWVDSGEDNYVKFTVNRGDESADSTVLDEQGKLNGFSVDFTDKKPFTVDAKASYLKNTRASSTQTQAKNINAQSTVSCSFKFELDGTVKNKTTIKDNY